MKSKNFLSIEQWRRKRGRRGGGGGGGGAGPPISLQGGGSAKTVLTPPIFQQFPTSSEKTPFFQDLIFLIVSI